MFAGVAEHEGDGQAAGGSRGHQAGHGRGVEPEPTAAEIAQQAHGADADKGRHGQEERGAGPAPLGAPAEGREEETSQDSPGRGRSDRWARLRRRHLVGAGLAGAGLALTLPPLGWWPLGPVGLAVVGQLAGERPWRTRLLLGGVAGLAFFAFGLAWVRPFSLPGYGLLVVLEAAFLGAALVVVPPGPGRLLAFPAALVLAEWARGHWPFGGLPLAGLGLGQVNGPLVGTAALGGALGVVALLGLAGAGLAASCCGRPNRRAGLAALVLVAILALVSPHAPRGAVIGRITVAAVQGGGLRGIPAVRSDPARVLERHLAATERIRRPVDLVLWPEDVVDVSGAFRGSPQSDLLGALARRLGATLVAGVVEDAPEQRFRNAAVAFGPGGSLVDRFDKVHRVPFGEYVPARDLVDVVADVSAVPRDALPSRGPGLLRTPVGPLGVVISYEVFFSDRARAAVRDGGSVLLVPTNASSFTGRQVPAQELAAARLRAIETGRFVLQAAPTGYSAVVDPTGRVLAVSGLGGPAILRRVVDLRSGATVYLRVGDAPLLGASLLGLALAWVIHREGVGRRQTPLLR